MARMMLAQDQMELPIGWFDERVGSAASYDHLIDPHLAVARHSRGKRLLPSPVEGKEAAEKLAARAHTQVFPVKPATNPPSRFSSVLPE